jgi:hypothetical protein
MRTNDEEFDEDFGAPVPEGEELSESRIKKTWTPTIRFSNLRASSSVEPSTTGDR